MAYTAVQQQFDYQRFLASAGADTVEYMEPIVNDPSSVAVPVDVLEQMASDLGTYDEYHLVYGIEVGMEHSPALFALASARFLSHESLSVQCAVYRCLSRLPPTLISETLIKECEAAIRNRKLISGLSDIVDVLRQRQGTQAAAL
ncbi:MAG TPA: hypothetical protein VE988_28585 [Gemmataceae bacterium]|nr:hypothetical protein [Gemmataceae bacterium]